MRAHGARRVEQIRAVPGQYPRRQTQWRTWHRWGQAKTLPLGQKTGALFIPRTVHLRPSGPMPNLCGCPLRSGAAHSAVQWLVESGENRGSSTGSAGAAAYRIGHEPNPGLHSGDEGNSRRPVHECCGELSAASFRAGVPLLCPGGGSNQSGRNRFNLDL